MNRVLLFVPSIVMLFALPASAISATVVSVKGRVLINHGDGFRQATSGTQANAGDRLMAEERASAKLLYSGGCQVKIVPGQLVSVGSRPPCTAPSLAGLEQVPPEKTYFNDPVLPFTVSAAIGWGIFCAATYCRDHNHGGGRPVSP